MAGKKKGAELTKKSAGPQRKQTKSNIHDPPAKKSAGKPEEEDKDHDLDDPDFQHGRAQERKRPESQLELSEEELDKEFTRVLTAQNTHASSNLVRFKHGSMKEWQTYATDATAMHFELDGYVIPVDSDEARRQQKDSGVGPDGEEGESQGPVPTLRNQFNFSVRSSQTHNNPMRDLEIQTQPPPCQSFSALVTQFEIWDAYAEDRRQKEAAESKPKAAGKENGRRPQYTDGEDDGNLSSISKGAKILERMVNQNTYDEIAQDYMYWEDPMDDFQKEGSLLPLWKFDFEKAKKKAVTALCYNSRFPDLFAVAYGSYDFMKQTPGIVCVYTLKNTSFPEYVFQLDSGVMTIDFSEQHPSLLCFGLYDGSVGIIDIHSSNPGPLYQSTVKSGKHADPVWGVAWQKDDLDKNFNFFSVSSDGKVFSWTLIKNELHHTEVVELKMEPTAELNVDNNTDLFRLGSGSAFDFSKFNNHVFAVGTEEGRIHLCSKAYNSRYLHTWNAHTMAIYSICWNPVDPNIFISCSADWTVRMWHQNHREDSPLFSFDLGTAVGCVAWAPYSSTIFACATADGKVYIFDLAKNKNEAVCVQSVVKRAKLTKVAFSMVAPILVVGDDRGGTYSLKLSPNLRKSHKKLKAEGQEKWLANEEQSIANILQGFASLSATN